MANRANDWIEQARRDLQHAESDLRSSFHEWACFSAQQAAEKAVKAIFYKLNADAWGHSITKLLKELSKNTEVDSSLIKAAQNLDRFYIPARYPNGFDIGKPADYYSEDDAKGAIAHANQIIRFCESHISEQPADPEPTA